MRRGWSFGTSSDRCPEAAYLVTVAALLTLVCALATLVGFYYLTVISPAALAAAGDVGLALGVAFVVAATYFVFGAYRATRQLIDALADEQAPLAGAFAEAALFGERMAQHVAITGALATATTLAILSRSLSTELTVMGLVAAGVVVALEVALVPPLGRQLMLPVLRGLRGRDASLSLRALEPQPASTRAVIVGAVILFVSVALVFTATIVWRFAAYPDGVTAGLLVHLGAVHLALTVLLVGVVSWHTRLALGPLSELARVVRRIRDVDVEGPVGFVGVGEVGALAEGFDEMLERLQASRHQVLEKERLLMHRQRLESIGTLALGVAHEINDPAASICANLEFLRGTLMLTRSGAGDGERLECLAAVADSLAGIDRIRNIAAALARHARGELKDEPTEFRLSALVESTMGLVRAQVHPGIQLDAHFRDEPTLFAPMEALRQIVINLVVNAAQSIGEKSGRIEVTCDSLGGRAYLEVKDDGPGIAPGDQAKVFEPLYTTKPVGVGTGLGLYICRAIAEREGGELTLESAPGDTRFRLWLPLPATTVADTSAAPARERKVRGELPIDVLFIDDDASARRSVQRAMKGRVRSFVGCEASEALTRLSRGDHFDVVVCDWLMPSPTGREVLSRVRSAHPELARRFAVLTAGEKDATRDLDQLEVPVFHKPCPVDQLVDWCAQVTAPTGSVA